MGRSFLFECPRCSYKAKVSGGADEGVRFCCQTVLCRECKKLYDAVTRLKVPDCARLLEPATALSRRRGGRLNSDAAPPFDTVLNRLTIGVARQFKWVRFKPRCPVSAIHKVQFWTEPGKCPRCGTYLERNALPFRIWE